MGLGFLLNVKYLLPATVAFLLMAVAALGFRARARRGYKPLCLGVAASIVIVGAKFTFDNSPAMWAGIGLLVVASLWNAWPKKRFCRT